uniref:ANK_REP_REGION domain-containing protein n=1 Tax=Anopheles dirus TaxID=7168 RepID=A0A182NYD2_9DIPT
MEGKNNASLHGISYQLKLGLVVLLRLYKMHKTDVQFDFELTFEDPAAGKFDDVLVRYNSWKNTQAGIACIQTKHRQHTSIDGSENEQQKSKTYETISDADLLSTKKKGQFSISMYFESFLDIHKPESEETQKYIICTNKTLDKRVSSLTRANLEDSCIPSFMRDINATFYQFDCAKKVENLDEILKGVAISKGYTEESSVSIIREFYDNFLLACGSVNETMLYGIVMKLLMQLVDFQHITTYEKFHVCMFEAINRGPKSLKPSDVDEMFKLSESGYLLEYFRISTMKHVESLRVKYFDPELNSTVLEETNLFKFLKTKTSGTHWYYSSCGTDVSILVIEQIANLADYEMVLFDSSSHKESDGLKDLCAAISASRNHFVNEVNNFPRKLITITTQGKTYNTDEYTELAAEYGMKFIIVEHITKDEKTIDDKTFDSFCVGDLTEDTRNELFVKCVNRFTTSVSLRKIIKLCDPLSFVYDLLEMNEVRSKSLHETRYEEIHKWYVGRRCSLYVEDSKHNDRVHFYGIGIDDVKNVAHSDHYGDVIDDGDDLINGLMNDNYSKTVNIFLNDAGLGKSTYFTKLSWRLSTISESSFVIRLNALMYSTDFKRLRETDIDHLETTDVIRKLFYFIHLQLFVHDGLKQSDSDIEKRRLEAQRSANLLTYSNGKVVVNEHKAKELNLTPNQLFELRLFEEKMNENLVILLLDGFDEIAPDYKQVVLKCFSMFAKLKGIRHFYLSSRPYHFISELKEAFPGCRMYQLLPFTKVDYKIALKNYILDKAVDCTEEKQNYILNIILESFESLPTQLLEVPLFARMTFEIRFPDIQEAVLSGKVKTMTQYKTLNILQLIEAFVEKKVQRRYLEKRGIPLSDLDKPGEIERFQHSLIETKHQHALLALFAIFNQEDRRRLLNGNEEREAIAYMERIKAASEKTGIISGVQDDIPQFILRILAEYFVALWLYENKDREENVKYFRSKSFWTREAYNIRDFFDRMILRESTGCEFHQQILSRAKLPYDWMQKYFSLLPKKDAVGRLPLHMAVVRDIDDSKMKDMLGLMSLDLINTRDELCQWSALDYAFLTKNERVVEMLLGRDAAVNLDTLLHQICANNLRYLLSTALDYGEWLKSNESTEPMANQLQSQVVEYLFKERQLDYNLPYRELVLKKIEYLNENENKFLNLILEHKPLEIITYLIGECELNLLSQANVTALFICALVFSIECRRTRNFKIVFEELCKKLNNPVLHDENTDVNACPLVESYIKYIGNIELKSLNECCVQHTEHDEISLPEFAEQEILHEGLSNHFIEALLVQAVYYGAAEILHYFVQKVNMTITNKLIVKILKLLPKHENYHHKTSIPAFNYLLDNTIDLNSVDEGGRNILHITAQTGCLYMLQCLIVKEFDSILNNARKGWNVLYYTSYNDDV